MNREIKFRGKYIYTEEWIYGNLVNIEEDRYAVLPVINSMRGETIAMYEVNPETIGQFTGMYDKNGKGIYEADRILINRNHYVVIFYKGMFAIEEEGCGYIPLRNVSTVCKVIGNVFDNPELLKEK